VKGGFWPKAILDLCAIGPRFRRAPRLRSRLCRSFAASADCTHRFSVLITRGVGSVAGCTQLAIAGWVAVTTATPEGSGVRGGPPATVISLDKLSELCVRAQALAHPFAAVFAHAKNSPHLQRLNDPLVHGPASISELVQPHLEIRCVAGPLEDQVARRDRVRLQSEAANQMDHARLHSRDPRPAAVPRVVSKCGPSCRLGYDGVHVRANSFVLVRVGISARIQAEDVKRSGPCKSCATSVEDGTGLGKQSRRNESTEFFKHLANHSSVLVELARIRMPADHVGPADAALNQWWRDGRFAAAPRRLAVWSCPCGE